MVLLYSKYSRSHYVKPKKLVKQFAISCWAFLPDLFVKPYESKLKFVFIVGCGHSGTTLLAGKLSRHSEVFAIGRESNAFSPPISAWVSRRIVSEWTYFASREQRSTILEKTPKHIHSLDKIKKILPGAMFFVLVRNPLDNIASLYERFGSLEVAISRWTIDNKKVLYYKQKYNFKLAKYELLTTRPEVTFKNIVAAIGLSWEGNVLEQGSTIYDATRQKGNMAVRSKQISQKISAKVNTWSSILTRDQAEYVLSRTKNIATDLGYYYTDNLEVRWHERQAGNICEYSDTEV